MATPTDAMIEASQALLIRFAQSETASSSSYCDLAIVLAETRADPAKAEELADVAEAFVSDLDDRALSSSPEWEALSRAVDDWRTAH